ncbi:hydro-lyase, Fe-S type, tartrate/fumarate subfamily subunit alpha [Advenella kashmirensis WT001]|uniref:Hydro-lyase, Fe-S type, tartrate/fumarate subfamily subunit alpha n=1 Tax=Advenella kashmirensis (strain DSM 17095 / LMG 22695 / WT001) TaxID=1036672 RepID=I3U7H0_ADVKW|nr:fumarate hydratase [Advenella kashmirensis]AFK60958.1 hydro-lyase, Fe-S type, tartrate/fumarate subfamily subunit alpha [Advenella kashmirensis WT001]
MAITFEMIKQVTAQLYERSLKQIPDDTRQALVQASSRETNETGRRTLQIMIESADAARSQQSLVCSDSGVPVYFMQIGTQAQFEGNVKQAIEEGFAELVATINPPLLPHVTNPLTLERGYQGKGMPITTFDLVDGADYIDITCSPKALGSGRWAALEIFSFPDLPTIENFVMETVVKAGSQPCPPVVIGVGIGGSFDYAAKMAKEATLRQIGTVNPEPILVDMEAHLLERINKTGFGPMGTGGDSTSMAVHINYCAGHGFTPVAVCFNCWINRRTRARCYNDGRIQMLE